MKKNKTEKIDIFKSAKMFTPTEAEAEDKAYSAIQVYLDSIKNDKEKIDDFSELVGDIIWRYKNGKIG